MSADDGWTGRAAIRYQPRTCPGCPAFVIGIGAPVTQHLVEIVPVALAAGIGEVDGGQQNLLAFRACRPGDRPSGVADDQALADEGLAAFAPDPVGGGDEHRVGMGRAHDQNVGHGLTARVLAGDRHPIGGHADRLRPLQGGEAKALREPAVVADMAADRPSGVSNTGKPRSPGVK